jgi:hypothetical protein
MPADEERFVHYAVLRAFARNGSTAVLICRKGYSLGAHPADASR